MTSEYGRYCPEVDIPTEPKERLFFAAKHGQTNKFIDLCEQEPNLLSEKDAPDMNLAIHVASSSGHVEIVKYILKNDNKSLHETNKYDQTPLHCAAMKNRIDVVRLLIERGADLNAKDKESKTVLHLAIKMQCQCECFDELLKHYSCFDTRDVDGNSLLHTAAENGLRKVCETLIKEKQVKVAWVNKNEENSLFSVLRKLKGENAAKMIQCLYEYTAEEDKEKILKQKNARGLTVTKVAKQYGNKEVVKFFKDELEKFYFRILTVDDNEKLDKVKLFVCGSENVGKTTLIKSLKKKDALLFRMHNPGSKHNPTPGIHIEACEIPESGLFSIWDFGGQPEFYLTHSLFIDAPNSITLVVYKICRTGGRSSQDELFQKIMEWLKFFKSSIDRSRTSAKKPTILLVATHADQEENRCFAVTMAHTIVKIMKDIFKDWLNILDEVIVTDARQHHDDEHDGMDRLRNVLKNQRNSLLQSQSSIPSACLKIAQHLEISNDSFPVKTWDEFTKFVNNEIMPIDDEKLEKATKYLQKIGEICILKVANFQAAKKRYVVLSPHWLCSNIFGRLLAPETFPCFIKRADRYTKDDILNGFRDILDINGDKLIELLVNLELCYEVKPTSEMVNPTSKVVNPTSEVVNPTSELVNPTSEEMNPTSELLNSTSKVVIPCKLISNIPPDIWLTATKCSSKIISYGRRISCKNTDIDSFPKNFFPKVQTSLVNYLNKKKGDPKLWRDGLKGSIDRVDFIIQMTSGLRAVHIVVEITLDTVYHFQITHQKRLDKCHHVLQRLIQHVNYMKEKTCPGTETELMYLSKTGLQKCKDPSEIEQAYLKKELLDAEKDNHGIVSKNEIQDNVDEILITGSSQEVLEEFKKKSDVKWIPTNVLVQVAVKMDPYLVDGSDYRALSAALNLEQECRSLEGKCESITITLLDKWSKKKGEVSTIKHLKKILTRNEIVEGIKKNRGDVGGELDSIFPISQVSEVMRIEMSE